MIHRRLILGGLLAAASGPAIVRASSLMPVVARKAPIWMGMDFARAAGDDYVVFVHPGWHADLVRWSELPTSEMIQGRMVAMG